jgi:ADP-heptose:LPS heptosyltransferase
MLTVHPLGVARNLLTHPVGLTRTVLETGRFLRAALPALMRGSGPRILFQRPGGLGDVICTFPAVLALRQKFPGATIVYRVQPLHAPIVHMGRVADVVLPVNNWPSSLPRVCEAVFDVVLTPRLEHERPTGGPRRHLVDDFCVKLGLIPTDRQPRLTVPRGLSERVLSELLVAPNDGRPLVAIHITPNWRVKEWTDAGWRELVSWLGRERHARVIQLGSTVYRNGGAANVTRIEGAVDCVGRFSLEETAACIQACDLFVGVDSGPMHIAGAVGTPSVALFGATDPSLHLPPETPSIAVVGDVPCLGCQHRTPILHWQDDCPNQIACMKALRVAEVAEACDRMLESSRGRFNKALAAVSNEIPISLSRARGSRPENEDGL